MPLVLAFLIYAASGRSAIATPKVGFSYDKLLHFAVFGLLATIVLRIPYFFNKGWKGVLIAVLLVSGYGAMDEFRQSFTPGRSVDFKDWLADTSGAILASIFYFKWRWYHRILEAGLPKKNKNKPAG